MIALFANLKIQFQKFLQSHFTVIDLRRYAISKGACLTCTWT